MENVLSTILKAGIAVLAIAVPVLMTMVLTLVLKDVLPEGNKKLITFVGIIIFLVLAMTMVYVVAQTLSFA